MKVSARPGTSASRGGISAHLAALSGAQKRGAGVPAYSRWINRPLARYAAAVLAAAHIGPDAVTILSAATSLAGLVVLVTAPAAPATGIVVAALLALGYVLDSADGQVARLTGRAGPAGEWLDHVVDAVRTPLIHVAVAVAVHLHGGPAWLSAVALGASVLSSGQFMSQILAEQLTARRGGPRPSPVDDGIAQSLVLLPADPGVLYVVCALWGSGPAFATGYTAVVTVQLIHAVVSMRRKHQRLRHAAAQ